MRAWAIKVYQSCCYPETGFVIGLWIVVVVWVMGGLGVTWQLFSREAALEVQRTQMEYRLNILENYISDDEGIRP